MGKNSYITYEGHIFDAWGCSGWIMSEYGTWVVLVSNNDCGNFTTHNDPIKKNGLADMLNDAKFKNK